MKIAVVGDTHHNKLAIKLILNKVDELGADAIIHLGDCVSDINLLQEKFKGNIYAVAGNCDYSTKYPKENIININGKKIFFTHGDLYNVKSSLNSIAYRAESLCVDIVLFGHTHMYLKEDYKGVIIMNPGSIPKPSPWSQVGCVGFVEIDDNGNIGICELYKISMN